VGVSVVIPIVLSTGLFACAEPSPVVHPTGSLSLLTYNVHGLPSAITGDDTLDRLEQIGPLLDVYDFVGLQEDFMEEGQALLDAGTTLPYRTRFSELVEPERVYGSGLSTYGRHPVLQDTGHFFTECHGILEGASDCLASKGFQVLSLEIDPGLAIFVVNTHIEAGGGEADETARASNVEALIAGMADLDTDAPLVFMGDTNLHPEDPVDGPLGQRFESELGLVDVCTLLDCPEPNRIDRIYIRSGAGASLEAVAWSVPEGFVGENGVDLSDHNAIQAQIQWARTGESD
jgi:endonuclease/exonuclease/phosphatase family metal-dependent hydrolase